MAHEVGINVKLVNRLGEAQTGVTVNLLDENMGATLRTETSDGSGRVFFTGVAAGTYDIEAVGASGSQYLRNYIVKNSYTVIPDGNVFNQESRYAVRSADVVPDPGIFTQAKDLKQGIAYGGQVQPVRVYGGNSLSPDLISVTGSRTLLSKQSGNSYYHLNQNVTFFQKAQILIG